jgi:hypothetical protein
MRGSMNPDVVGMPKDRKKLSIFAQAESVLRVIRFKWDLYEWPVVISAGLISVFLGTIGFWQYNLLIRETHSDISFTFWDCLYQSIQLFSLQGAFDRGVSVPFLLEIVRFACPVIAAYTFFQALKEIFQRQILLFQLRRVRGHYIICGLGRKGMLLTKELIEGNEKVVVIEQDGANAQIKTCAEIGVLMVIGDARDQRTLINAGVLRARHLIAVCSEDSVNAEIAEQIRALSRSEQLHDLTCTIHIVDTYLWTLFREREFTVEHSSSLLLDFFNIYDSGARILLRETIDESLFANPQLHILIIGMGDLGQNLVIHAARKWCLRQANDSPKLSISIVDPDVERKLDALKFRYPLVECACKFILYSMNVNGSEFRNAILVNNGAAPLPITHAYVCMDDISAGLQTGFALLRLLQGENVNILVRMSEDTGLASFMGEVKGPDYITTNLKAFGLLDRTCKLNLFDDGTHESLARAMHDAYLEQEFQKGHTASENPNLVAWEDLSEETRISNRYLANHIGVKLNAIRCGYMPWQDYNGEKFIFTPREIDQMAVLEHERWREEKIRQGWHLGSQRNDGNKLHPDLAGWDEGLSEEAKEKTRQTVRIIPNLLARAGFQIYRLPNP